MDANDGSPVQGLGDGRQLAVGALDKANHGEVQLDEQLPLTGDALLCRNLLGGENPGPGRELDHRVVVREDGGQEEMRGGQRRVAAERDLERRRHDTLIQEKNDLVRRWMVWPGMYLRDGGEPSELEPRGGAVAEEEGGHGEVELGGDGLQPPLVRGHGGVLQEAHRGRVALERLRREGVHLRQDAI